MKKVLTAAIGLFLVITLYSQDRPPHSELENPAIQGINKELPRASFVSYESKELALKNNNEASSRFISLNMSWKVCGMIF
jgi:beta-galactosidase